MTPQTYAIITTAAIVLVCMAAIITNKKEQSKTKKHEFHLAPNMAILEGHQLSCFLSWGLGVAVFIFGFYAVTSGLQIKTAFWALALVSAALLGKNYAKKNTLQKKPATACALFWVLSTFIL